MDHVVWRAGRGVHRTIKVKLATTKGQEKTLLRTMGLYAKAFEASAHWGFQNRNSNKIDHHTATYRIVRLTYRS